ncbi:MAG: nucleoside-diphosphate sugar epimerase [Pseudomonadota bacterium]|nr:nucleoside-diphosphate sugar epimerase [Pseudomonadota bacterium]
MKTALVIGASGLIGGPLLARLLDDGWRLMALSRQAARSQSAPQLQWLQGSLQVMPALPAAADVIISAGPLDAFADWHAAHDVGARRVIAFGSTSVAIKADSADGAERDVAARLARAEALLQQAATARGTALTLLRPTLIYGQGVDRSLSRVVQIATRYRRFALPTSARGLRQPVHADDLAAAAVACIDTPASFGQTYALPGGETLDYIAMVRRVLATLDPPPTLHLLPMPLFARALWIARVSGKLGGFNDAMLARMREDLVFDSAPARRDFAYQPRAFEPERAMFVDG